MNRALARRQWEAARAKGVRPLSWRMYVALLDCARKGGSHEANHGAACYDLEKRGFVKVSYPFAHATDAGRAVLASIGAVL